MQSIAICNRQELNGTAIRGHLGTFARRDAATTGGDLPQAGIRMFDGLAAHISLMRDEILGRKGCRKDTEFLDLVGATNLIPVPNSTELAIHFGSRMAGWSGLFVIGA